MAEKKQTLWTRLMGGQLPSLDVTTDIAINQQSVINAGVVVFIVVVLLMLSYFGIRKQFKA